MRTEINGCAVGAPRSDCKAIYFLELVSMRRFYGDGDHVVPCVHWYGECGRDNALAHMAPVHVAVAHRIDSCHEFGIKFGLSINIIRTYEFGE